MLLDDEGGEERATEGEGGRRGGGMIGVGLSFSERNPQNERKD